MQGNSLQISADNQKAAKIGIVGEDSGGVRNSFQRLSVFLRNARRILREEGVKALFRTYGWRLVAAFFVYYLIRDSFLYLLLPYLIAQGLLN